MVLVTPIFSAIFVGMQIKRMIPNLLTAGNLVGGILAIIFILEGKPQTAAYCILISGVFDFLDGFAARLLKVQNEIGKQLDSLADMVTFGVAPGLLVMHYIKLSLLAHGMTEFDYLKYGGLIIPVAALFRLAKFNLDSRQSDAFIGLPTPAMTIFFVGFLFFPAIDVDPNNFANDVFFAIMHPATLLTLTVIFSVLMVSELPLFALKFKHFKWSGNEIRYIFLTISIVLLATLFVWALPIIILLYIILSLINNLTKKQTKDEIQS